MGDDYPQFSDFYEGTPQLEGEKKDIREILNIKILVTGYIVRKSKYYKGKDYLTLQFENGGKKQIIFTSSEPLIAQAKEADEKKKIPFHTTIVKRGNYYTMT